MVVIDEPGFDVKTINMLLTTIPQQIEVSNVVLTTFHSLEDLRIPKTWKVIQL